MTSRTAQFVRAYESVAADTPRADRWDALGEAIEQHGRDIDAYAEQVRADRIEWRERLEAFNRASHSDALREMEPVHMRTTYDGLEVTSIVGTGTNYLPAMALGLCFVLTCIAVQS